MHNVKKLLQEKAVMICFGTISCHSSVTEEDTGKSPDGVVVEVRTGLL
jgi:hypothetical protein